MKREIAIVKANALKNRMLKGLETEYEFELSEIVENRLHLKITPIEEGKVISSQILKELPRYHIDLTFYVHVIRFKPVLTICYTLDSGIENQII